MPQAIDLTGKTIGQYVLIALHHRTPQGAFYSVQCTYCKEKLIKRTDHLKITHRGCHGRIEKIQPALMPKKFDSDYIPRHGQW
jgi:hypothetical protein